MSELLVAGKLVNWLERNNGIIGSVSLGVVVLAIVIATLHFAPRADSQWHEGGYGSNAERHILY